MRNCGHCGYEGPLEGKGEDIEAQRWTQHIDGYGDCDLATIWTLFRCPQCGEPTLARYLWTDFFDPDDVQLITIYPKPQNREGLPPNVSRAYQLAQRGRTTDPAFYAVGMRRTLEAICDHEQVPARTANGAYISLDRRLKALKDNRRVPDDLGALMLSLKEVGNLGAHEEHPDPTHEDIGAVADLLEALLEYLYRAPARLKAVRESFAKRGITI